MKNDRHATDFIVGGLPDGGPDRWSDAGDELPTGGRLKGGDDIGFMVGRSR